MKQPHHTGYSIKQFAYYKIGASAQITVNFKALFIAPRKNGNLVRGENLIWDKL